MCIVRAFPGLSVWDPLQTSKLESFCSFSFSGLGFATQLRLIVKSACSPACSRTYRLLLALPRCWYHRLSSLSWLSLSFVVLNLVWVLVRRRHTQTLLSLALPETRTMRLLAPHVTCPGGSSLHRWLSTLPKGLCSFAHLGFLRAWLHPSLHPSTHPSSGDGGASHN